MPTQNEQPSDHIPLAMLGAGLLVLYVPTLWGLFNGIWLSDTQAHGPMILVISCWLIYRAWPQMIAATPSADTIHRTAQGIGWLCILVGACLYSVGRSQSIEFIELGSLIWVFSGMVLAYLGPTSLKVIWFPLFFMLFMVPLPGLLVAAVTMPMKIAVSFVA